MSLVYVIQFFIACWSYGGAVYMVGITTVVDEGLENNLLLKKLIILKTLLTNLLKNNYISVDYI